jgi:hypothetical protein
MKYIILFSIFLTLPFCGYDHPYRLIGQEPSATQKEDNLNHLKALDKLFLPFRLGMSIEEVQKIADATGPPRIWATMPTATEYGDASIRYFWLYLKNVELSARLLNTLGPCTENGNIVFLFSDKKLVAISYRAFQCHNAEQQFLTFIDKIGASATPIPTIYHKQTIKGEIVISKGWGKDETWKYNIDYRVYDIPIDTLKKW